MGVRDSITIKRVESQGDCLRSALGNRLRKVRNTLGLSQKEMAAKLGIATSTYQYYERGERDTPAFIFCKLVTMFRVSPGWLLTGEGETFQEPDIPSDDKILTAIIAFIRDVWEKGDEKEKHWFEIQFQKCFPEFIERKSKEKSKH